MNLYILLGILILIYVFKIPIVCYGCESPEGISKYIFKCANDTTEICEMSKNIDNLIPNAKNKLKVITDTVFRELTVSLPNFIKNILNDLINKITGLGTDLKNTIVNLYSKFTEFLASAFTKVKDVFIKTLDQFYSTVIKPIIDFISIQIVKPITEAIAMVVSFKEIVKTAITDAIRDVTGTLMIIPNAIIQPIMKLPEGIEYLINLFINGLNTIAKGAVDGLNITVNGLFTGIEVVVNAISTGINSVMSGITSGINKVVNTVAKPVIDIINAVLGAYNGLRNLEVNLLVTKLRPFGWLPEVNGISFNGIDLTPPTIPEVNLPDVNIPQPTPIPEISFKEIGETVKKGLTQVFDTATDGIRKAYETAMKPINDTIQNLITLLSSIYVTMRTFIDTYLSLDFMKKVFNKIKEGIEITISEAIKIIKDNIFTPIYKIYLKIKDEIEGAINFIIRNLKTLFVTIFGKLNELFQKTSESVYDLSKYFVNNISTIAFYYVTYVIGILIPIPISTTAKVNFVIGMSLFVLYLFISQFIESIYTNIVFIGIALTAFVAMTFFIPTYKPEPPKEPKKESEIPEKIERFTNTNTKTKQNINCKMPYNCTNYTPLKSINLKTQYVI